jgi:hypothetical protein
MSDDILINAPCHENWDTMQQSNKGLSAQRFCQSCDKHVHHLNDMPLRERESLLAKASEGESICVRFHAPSLSAQNWLDRVFNIRMSAPLLAAVTLCVLLSPMAQAVQAASNTQPEPCSVKPKHTRPILMGKIKPPSKPPKNEKTGQNNNGSDTVEKPAPPIEPVKMGALMLPMKPTEAPNKH